MVDTTNYMDDNLTLRQRTRKIEAHKAKSLLSSSESETELNGQVSKYKEFYDKYSSDNDFKKFLYGKIKSEFFDSGKIQGTPEKLFYTKYGRKIKGPEDWALPNLMRLFSYIYIYDRDNLSRATQPGFAGFVGELNLKHSDAKKFLTLKDEVSDKSPNIINPLSTDTNLEKYHFLVQLYNFENFVDEYQNEQSKVKSEADLVKVIKPALNEVAASVQPQGLPKVNLPKVELPNVPGHTPVSVEEEQEEQSADNGNVQVVVDLEAIAKDDGANSKSFGESFLDSISDVGKGLLGGIEKIGGLFSSSDSEKGPTYEQLNQSPRIGASEPLTVQSAKVMAQPIPAAPEKTPLLPQIGIDVTYLKGIGVKVESRYVKFTNKRGIESRRKVTYCVISTRETLKKLLNLSDKDVLAIIPHGDASKKISSFKSEIAKAKKEKRETSYVQLDYFKALDYMRKKGKNGEANLFPIYVETPNGHAALAIYGKDDNIHFIDTLAKDKVTNKSGNVNPISEEMYVLGKYKFYVPVKGLLVSNEHILQLAQANQDKKRKKS